MQFRQFFHADGAKNPFHIAIVGMGVTGNVAFCQLVRKLVTEKTTYPDIHFHIHLYDANRDTFATGDAFKSDLSHDWLLNDPTKGFFLTSDKSLAIWLKENPEKWRARFPEIDDEQLAKIDDYFVPRALAGLYLEDQLASYENEARFNDIRVTKHYTNVADIAAFDQYYRLTSDDAAMTVVNTLFLCLGHSAAKKFLHLRSFPNFIASPYNLDALSNIPRDEDVYIIGSQASAVDGIASLTKTFNHTGPIHLLTRYGTAITAKGKEEKCDDELPVKRLAERLTTYASGSLSYDEAMTLFWDTYRASVIDCMDSAALPDTKRVLDYQLAVFEGRTPDMTFGNPDKMKAYTKVFFFGCLAIFWDKLDEAGRAKCMQGFYSFFFAYVTGIPPINAKMLLTCYQRGQVVDHSGLTNITYDDVERVFVLEFGADRIMKAKYVIDASGLGYEAFDLPLLNRLKDKCMIVAKKTGGLDVTDAFRAVDEKGRAQDIFLLGPTVKYGSPPSHYAVFLARQFAEKAITVLSNELKCDDEAHLRMAG